MSIKIRLSKTGRKKAGAYRIVVSPLRAKREGNYIDILGFYNPKLKPAIIKFDERKYKSWLEKGAQPSEGVRKILNEKTA